MRKAIIILAALASHAGAQSYSVNLLGGRTGTASLAGMTSYNGNFRIDTRLKNCVNPNTAVTHNLVQGGPGNLRWSATANRLEASFAQDLSGGGNIAFLSAAAWPSEVEIRVQRRAGAGGFISIEKWNAAGDGHEFQRRSLTGTNSATYTALTVGSANLTSGPLGTGCEVAFVRVYLDYLPIGSAPPTAITSPATGSLRDWEFNDQASPAADSSGNGVSMTFSITPTWGAEDMTPACWATTAGNQNTSALSTIAGQPVSVATYMRGGASSQAWTIVSQPSAGVARLSNNGSATPQLVNATTGSYSFSVATRGAGGTTASCTLAMTVTNPTFGTGGYLIYSFGANFAAYPGTDKIRVSVIQPNGTHVISSPRTCSSSPCSMFIDDSGLGLHSYRIERLNSSGAVIQTSRWKPLKATQVAITTIPAPPRSTTGTPLMAVPYQHSSDFADEFVATRFDYRIAGGGSTPSPNSNPALYNPALHWAYYIDMASIQFASEYYNIRSHAVTNGWNYEDYFMHCSIDHGNEKFWTWVNRFGEDQRGGTTSAQKGVMIWNAATSAFLAGPDDPETKLSGGAPDNVPTPDHSVAGWDSVLGDIPIVNNNTMYIGSQEPFDTINVVIGTSRSGGSYSWEYCSASSTNVCTVWSALTVTDGSTGFSVTASPTTIRTITFSPPSLWKPVIVNSSQPRFYVRVTVTGSSVSPVLSRVYGDTWFTESSTFSITASSSFLDGNTPSTRFTTSAPNPFLVGDMIYIFGTTGGWVTAMKGNNISAGYLVVTRVYSSTEFAVAKSSSGLGAYPGGFTVSAKYERGWDPTSGTIVTVAGGYQYNPTPPANATAKFRYQARMRSFYGDAASSTTSDWFLTNYTAGSPVKYYGRYMADKIITRLNNTAEGFNSFMADNADAWPETISLTTATKMEWPITYDPWQDANYNTVRASMADMFTQLRDYVRLTHPNAKIGGNAAFRTGSICWAMDFCLLENRMVAGVPYAYAETVNSSGDPAMGYDTNADPVKNPNGSIMFMACQSSDTLDPVDDSGTQYWYDKADRRPMLCLASHYVGWNGEQTTGFSWNAHGAVYSQDDDIYYMSADTVLTTAITANTSTAQKTFDLADVTQLWSNGTGNAPYPDMVFVIGEPPNAEYISAYRLNGSTVTTTSALYKSWPIGTPVRVRKLAHQAVSPIPWERLLWVSIYFPAMSFDIGVPKDPNPATGRNLAWATPAQYGGPAGSLNMYMREYENTATGVDAIVIFRPVNTGAPGTRGTRQNTCSTNARSLGGTYYRLHADGKTEATPYTTIKLREGEAFIGLTSPTAQITEVPAWQQNTCP